MAILIPPRAAAAAAAAVAAIGISMTILGTGTTTTWTPSKTTMTPMIIATTWMDSTRGRLGLPTYYLIDEAECHPIPGHKSSNGKERA